MASPSFNVLPATQNDEIGGDQDSILLQIGEDTVTLAESYEVKISVLQQPAAFALRVGANLAAGDMLSQAVPGSDFKLGIMSGGKYRLLQAGKIDSRGAPSAAFSQIEIKGRDYLAQLFDSFVEEEQEFPQKTFFDLTQKVMNLVGLTNENGFGLVATNDVNRALITGVDIKTINPTELATQIQTGAMTGTGELVYKTMKAQLGVRYYDFLQQQYKLAGLFLWACPDKTFVLARPHADQAATFSIFRRLGGTGEDTNVIDCRFVDDTTMRHSEAIVYGKSGGGKKGVEICRGSYVDDQLSTYGITKKIVIHDADVKTKAECEYVARRIIADERRAGWQLEYTLAGHQVPFPSGDNGVAVWSPDTVVRVDDLILHEPSDVGLQFRRNFYVESVTYSRDNQGGTRTKVTLMRPEDLIFATGLTSDGDVIQRKQKQKNGKTVR